MNSKRVLVIYTMFSPIHYWVTVTVTIEKSPDCSGIIAEDVGMAVNETAASEADSASD